MLNRIWKKFTLALLIVAFVPIGYFGYRHLEDVKSSIPDRKLSEIFLNTVTRSKDIERTFLNAHTDIEYLRSNLVIEFYLDLSNQPSSASAYWKRLMQREFALFLLAKKGYSQIGLLDEYGKEVVVVSKNSGNVTALEESKKRSRVTSSYFVRAATLDRYGVAAIPMRSSVEAGQDLGQITLIRYATKVFDSKGEPRGVIYIDLNGSEILYSLTDTNDEKRGETSFITSHGSYIHNAYTKDSKVKVPIADHPNIFLEFPASVTSQMLSGKPGVISNDPDNLIAFSPVFPQVGNRDIFYLLFNRYPKSLFAPMFKEIKHKYFTGGVMVFLLCVVVAMAVSRALTHKLGMLREGVENIRERKLNHRLDIRSGDEIESLAKAYNMMASALQDYSHSLETKVEERSQHIKTVERKLMQAEKLGAIGFLAAGVAHEINNPITIIVTRLELIKKALKKGNTDKLRDDLDTLERHAKRISQITGDLLTFSRERPNEIGEADINDAVTRVAGLIGLPIRKKGIELKLLLGSGLPAARASVSGIEQVIYNLVYNAYQATQSGGSITVTTKTAGENRVVLLISDTGGGIPKKNIKHIFEPFFTTKDVGEGTGLGLSISYGHLKNFGGSINVESDKERGTTFTITLEAKPNEKVKGSAKLIGFKA